MITDDEISTNQKRVSEPQDWLVVVLNRILIATGFIGLGVMIVTILSADMFPPWNSSVMNSDKGIGSGVFGDAFGFATSIFTGSAFLGLFITMRMQRTELREIRAERRIAQKTLDLQVKQNNTIQKDLDTRRLEDRIMKLIDAIRALSDISENRMRHFQADFVKEFNNFGNLYLGFSKDSCTSEQLRKALIDINKSRQYRAIAGAAAIPEMLACLKAMKDAKLHAEFLPILQNALHYCPPNFMCLIALENQVFNWVEASSLAPFVNQYKSEIEEEKPYAAPDFLVDFAKCIEKLGGDPKVYL